MIISCSPMKKSGIYGGFSAVDCWMTDTSPRGMAWKRRVRAPGVGVGDAGCWENLENSVVLADIYG